jgi:hypothetical protein
VSLSCGSLRKRRTASFGHAASQASHGESRACPVNPTSKLVRLQSVNGIGAILVKLNEFGSVEDLGDELVRVRGTIGMEDGHRVISVAQEDDMVICAAPQAARKLLIAQTGVPQSNWCQAASQCKSIGHEGTAEERPHVHPVVVGRHEAGAAKLSAQEGFLQPGGRVG